MVPQVPMSLNLLQSECKDKTQVMCHMARKAHGGIGFAFVFVWVVDKNLKTPKLSAMVDSAIASGGIGSLGSLVLYLWLFQKLGAQP